MDEQRDWYHRFLDVAEQWEAEDAGVAAKIREMLGRRVADLVIDEGLAPRIQSVAGRLSNNEGWLEAWSATNQLLTHGGISGDERDRLVALAQIIAPSSLHGRVLAAATLDRYVEHHEGEADPERAHEHRRDTAVRIGKELADDITLVEELMPVLLSSHLRGDAFSIGRGLATKHTDPAQIWTWVREALAQKEANDASIMLVRGMLSGWNEANIPVASELEGAITDRVLGSWFPELQMMLPLDDTAMDRILRSLRVGLAPIWQYRYLSYGGVLKPVSAKVVVQLLEALAEKGEEGLRVAMDILSMVIYAEKERTSKEQRVLGDFARTILLTHDWGQRLSNNEDHEFEQVISFAARQSDSFDQVQPVLERILSGFEAQPIPSGRQAGDFIRPIFMAYCEDTLTLLSERLPDELEPEELQLFELQADESPAPLQEALVEWCREAPASRCKFAIRICLLPSATEEASSPVDQIFELAPDKLPVIQALADRGSPGYSSSEVPTKERIQRVLERWQHAHPGPVADLIQPVLARLSESLAWWRKFMESTHGHDRDDGFE
jgi:hypothetical protein